MNIYREPTQIRLEFETPEKAEAFEMWLRFALNLATSGSAAEDPPPGLRPPVRLNELQLRNLEAARGKQKNQIDQESQRSRKFRSGDLPWKTGRD